MAKNNNRSGKIVRFMATKTVEKPTRVSFHTKDGNIVTFNATESVKIKESVRFKTNKKK